jgi:hypothetical protein
MGLVTQLSIPLFFLLAIVGGGILFLIVERILEQRYFELFNQPSDVDLFRGASESKRNPHPIEVELEAMHRQE